jgi:hypothetical protein
MLPTKMYELHQWYMKASEDGYTMITARVKDSHLHQGLADIWIEFVSLWFLYHQDTLDKSLLCKCFLLFLYSSSTTSMLSHPLFCFVSYRMKLQECRRRGHYHISFMDLDIINENSVNKWPNQTENNIFRALDGQDTCTFILLPYNFK